MLFVCYSHFTHHRLITRMDTELGTRLSLPLAYSPVCCLLCHVPTSVVLPHTAACMLLLYRYDIDCHLVDNAISQEHNAGFTHWCSAVTNRETQEQYHVEGIEVELFCDDGRFKHVWLFRDPMDFERDLLSGQLTGVSSCYTVRV